MITPEALTDFMQETFTNARFIVKTVDNGHCTMIQEIGEEQLRPGGTVSGPTLMGLADAAMYGAIIGALGLNDTSIMSVTTSLNINFLRKPKADDGVKAVCDLIKVGKRLIIGEISLYSVGEEDKPVAHVVATYSVPG
ncbi:MAG: PaaI family thioesterase [Candidatus Pelagadaptatus aseana]|uniref:PaaI family thioesterase n=1 Tax=Candidatus Pelagadaptatus aseana TaxID=3120508 RepID=UPI0039B2E09A